MKVSSRMVILTLLSLVVVLCLIGSAAAQAPGCVAWYQYCPICGDPPIPGVTLASCMNEGFWLLCPVNTNACTPGRSHEETWTGGTVNMLRRYPEQGLTPSPAQALRVTSP